MITARVAALSLCLIAVGGCGSGTPAANPMTNDSTIPTSSAAPQVTASQAPVPQSAAPTRYATDELWRKAVEQAAPSIATWSDPQVAIIAQQLCGVLDKKSQVTTTALDGIVQDLMDGPAGSSRTDSRTYLTMTINQFCPSYSPVMAKYLAS